MKQLLFACLFICASGLCMAQQSDKVALERAAKLIERLGGNEIWGSAKYLYAKEKINRLNSENEITGEFWRSYTKPAHMEKYTGVGVDFLEARDANGGYTQNKGKIEKLSEEDLAAEWKGSQQEPYQIYHRIARQDTNLIIKMAGESRLDFYEKTGRHLCWIIIDKTNAPVSWGNIYRGRLNQHVYGPLKKFGDVFMPAWGSSIDANFRFEYLDVRLYKEELVLPAKK